MLSRRLIRIKVLQALYSFFISADNDLPAAEKLLIRNIDRVYELYIHILSFLVELHEFYQQRTEEAKEKFLPTDEERNPNARFVDNRVAKQLFENKDLRKKCQQFKVIWADETEMFRTIYHDLKASKEYSDYLNAPSCTYDDDRNFLIRIVRNFVYPSHTLQSYFEERNIHWADDFDTSLMMVLTTLKAFGAGQDEFVPLPTLFDDDDDESEDLSFARNLFSKTIIYSNEFSALISAKAENWEIERIALMDVILLKMAITELLHMSSIPIKVTLNEYIEIAKQYSTPKSKIFVNGILDKLIVQFRENNELQKTGRGLIDN
ncbi:MAG: transcription antitermination factor NusB [Bacteroidales bacterium]|nr:transcription antitermination factor NusB [Bacteroidales bacterium]MDZ4205246.1 transcription antitermination factor NusB [Bacteroidales bacterium]